MEAKLRNQDDTNPWYADIYTKGFVLLKEPVISELINFPPNFQFINKEERLRDNGSLDLPADMTVRFEKVAQILRFKYLEPNWGHTQFRKFITWDGVDKDNQYWHTDVFEDMNVFFLYYFDDTFPETGGGIHFKAKDQIYSLQPKAGDLIMISNKRGFFHKADATSIRRRVASFDFMVSGDI